MAETTERDNIVFVEMPRIVKKMSVYTFIFSVYWGSESLKLSFQNIFVMKYFWRHHKRMKMVLKHTKRLKKLKTVLKMSQRFENCLKDGIAGFSLPIDIWTIISNLIQNAFHSPVTKPLLYWYSLVQVLVVSATSCLPPTISLFR